MREGDLFAFVLILRFFSLMTAVGFGIVSPARKKYKVKKTPIEQVISFALWQNKKTQSIHHAPMQVDYPTMYAVSKTDGDDAYKFK